MATTLIVVVGPFSERHSWGHDKHGGDDLAGERSSWGRIDVTEGYPDPSGEQFSWGLSEKFRGEDRM